MGPPGRLRRAPSVQVDLVSALRERHVLGTPAPVRGLSGRRGMTWSLQHGHPEKDGRKYIRRVDER